MIKSVTGIVFPTLLLMAVATDAIGQPGAVQSLFDAKCVSCHAGENAAKKLKLDSWEHVIEGGRHGEAVIPFDGSNSLMIELVTKSQAGPHPSELDADTLTADEIAKLRAWIDNGAKSEEGITPFSESQAFIYVCNEGAASVSVIDAKADVVARTIDLQSLGFSAQAKPHHVAVERDGSFWYVSLIGDDVVLKFDSANKLVGQVAFERPGLMVLDPAGTSLFVGRSMKAVNPPQRIGIIDRVAMTLEEVDVFIPRPHAIATSADGAYVYTASLAANQVIAMTTESLEADLLNLPGPVHVLVQFALSPDGKTLVAGGQVSGKLLFFDLSRPEMPELMDSLSVKAMPWHPVYSRNGQFLYFPNKGANSVTVVNAAQHSLAAVISGRGLAQPHGSALSADGTKLYVASNNADGSYHPRYDFGDNANVGTVTVIDTDTRRILKVIEVEENATGIGAR